MSSLLKRFISTLRRTGDDSESGTSALKSASTTCPPPGATNVRTIFIFCFYTDADGNSGWCILQ